MDGGPTGHDIAGRALRELHVRHRGVYAVGTPHLTPIGVTYAGVRAVGDGACACSASAAGLRELSSCLPPKPHVLTTRSVRGPAGVVLHRTRTLLPGDVTEGDKIPTVSVTRLLLDAAAAGDDRRTTRWLKQARRMRVLDEGGLATRARGRPGGRLLLELLGADEQPDSSTDFDDALAALIPLAGLAEPERERPLGRFRLDFFWPELLLCVEADSWKDHGHRGGFETDRERA